MTKKPFPSIKHASKRGAKRKTTRAANSKLPPPQNAKEARPSGESLQGRKVILPDVEPWPEPVNGAELLLEIADTLRSYVVMPDGAADAVALWCAHTHALESFECSPRLNAHSPEKGCGKTTLRDVVANLVRRPLPADNLTPAVLFRIVQSQSPTLLADEYDAWLRDKEELRGMLNAGHKRGGAIYRCVGDNHEVRKFECFAPVLLCGIGSLPATLRDRSIVIRLIRAKPGELSKRFDARHTGPLQELCRKLARWGRDNASRLENCDPALPSGVVNRLADNWRPLFAIAEIAGGDWPQQAANAFAKLNELRDEDGEGVGIALLTDIRGVFENEKVERLGSQDLCAKLADLEARPWSEFGRHKEVISTHELARILRPFGIQPRNTKFDGGQVRKAYHVEDFQDAFARYLPPEGDASRYPATKAGNIGDSEQAHPLPSATGSGLDL